MAVLNPLKVVITNYQGSETLEGPWHAQNQELGRRELPFSAEIYIEQDDFAKSPPPKWKRLSPGEMVRLRYAYIIRCDEVIEDDDGDVVQLNCTYFADSKSGQDTSGLKPKGVVHWVDANAGVPVNVMDYGRLFKVPNPSSKTFLDDINADSLTRHNAIAEPALLAHDAKRFQFERQGYFCLDEQANGTVPVFNKTVSLREGF
jgi:glutaminyl-tRNA synthetase